MERKKPNNIQTKMKDKKSKQEREQHIHKDLFIYNYPDKKTDKWTEKFGISNSRSLEIVREVREILLESKDLNVAIVSALEKYNNEELILAIWCMAGDISRSYCSTQPNFLELILYTKLLGELLERQ